MERLVLDGLRTQAALLRDQGKVPEGMERMENRFVEAAAFEREIERLQSERDKYLGLRAGLYEDWKREIITEEDFRDFGEIYEKRCQELQRAITRQKETGKELLEEGVTGGSPERIKNAMQITELDRLTLVSFVRRILVYEDKRVSLEFRYPERLSGCKKAAERGETV